MSKRIKSVVYGEGGHDETKPNQNIVETIYYTDDELAQVELQEKAAADKAAILSRLGLTEEELKTILG